jgi:eukaryotic-like serine/threonine-protein kinase
VPPPPSPRGSLESSWSPPSEIEEFHLERRLGSGASGDVWLARDTLLERGVALKIASEALNDEVRARFRMEARAIARLQHPNVLAVHYAGEVDAHPYLVTELLSGKSLDALDLPLDPARVAAIGIDLARGLSAAHRLGVIHRDIKPANAFLGNDGVAKLIDFGLAKLHDTPADLAATALASNGEELTMGSTQPGHTISGRVAGTPLYMAPETWRGEAPTPRTDIYSLGALLFELLTGRPPVVARRIEELRSKVLAGAIDSLADLAREAPAPLVELISRCLSFNPNQRPTADELCDGLAHLVAQPVAADPPDDPTTNPYRGLLTFGPEHRALFFGREAETAAALAELRANPFVLVVGPSGSGKSSLVRAGVFPRVEAGDLGAEGALRPLVMVPGERPLEVLAQITAPALGLDEELVAARLADGSEWLAQELRAKGARLLLFVDQLEEIWTLASADERKVFLDALAAIVHFGPGTRIIATLRVDFLPRLEDLGALQEEALRAAIALGPLTPDGLRAAIVEPALRRGVLLEATLVDRLATAAQGGSLPLLEFALAALWDRRDPAATSLGAEALDSLGGVEGALAAHADEALARMPPAERLEARRLLLALVTVDRTRARCEEDELLGASKEARAALDGLVGSRLVVASAGERSTAYEIAHEALVRAWPRLQAWVDEEMASREEAERVRRAAAEWERLGRGGEALFGAEQVRRLDVLGGQTLGARESAFVAASRAAVRRARQRRLALRVGTPLALLALVVGVAVAIRWSERRQTSAFVAARLSEAEAIIKDAYDLDAQTDTARADAFARYDSNDWPGGEAGWYKALALASRAADRFGDASGAVSLALARDPLDASARARAADIAYRWLLLAERDHKHDLARELGARLALVDDDGSRRARLDEHAHLRVTTVPPGARVLLHPVRVDAAGRRVEDEGRAIVEGAPLELEPGSYLLEASAPGRYSTRLPVLLGRAQDEHIELPLPPSAAIPPGFVYVPAGVSLVGATDVEAIRTSLSEEPEHLVQVDAFLIGEDEVTYAEYLEFLASLPAAERAVRRPLAGGLKLIDDRDGVPSLTLGATTARRGDPFCRPKRGRRSCQDWLRFPVAGISQGDAQAYVAWLASTRVPGARLCSEREWERAARGADGRLYSNGDVLHPGDANFHPESGVDEAQIGVDEVGSYPLDVSPFAVLDLSGNVAEWVGRVGAIRAARGGAWREDSIRSRAAYRHVHHPEHANHIGIRACASPRTP